MSKLVNNLKHKFNIGNEELNEFKYVGLNIVSKLSEIELHQNDYIDSISLIPVDRDRLCHLESPLTSIEAQQLKRLGGQLIWVASQTRPDMAFAACDLSVSFKSATVKTLLQANKYVKKLKGERVVLKLADIGQIDNARIVSYSDASFANLESKASQGGFIVFLLGSNGKCALIPWQSHKISRVVKSTLAAETLAFQDGSEASVWLREIIREIYHLKDNPDILPVHSITDSKSLFDALLSKKQILDRRLKIDICVIRDMMDRQEISKLHWVSTELQLADCLTKRGASSRKHLDVLNNKEPLILPN